MEWTYTIVTPFTINSRSLFDVTKLVPQTALDSHMNHSTWTFNPGEIDEPLYSALVKGYPDHVKRTPKNELVAAVYAARGLG